MTFKEHTGLFTKPSILKIEKEDIDLFWLKFIIDDQLISKDRALPLLKEPEELTAIFISSRKTARQKNRQLKIFN